MELAISEEKIQNNFKERLSAAMLPNNTRKLLRFDLTYISNATF